VRLDPKDLELLGLGPGAWASSCEALLSGVGSSSAVSRTLGDGRKDASRYADARSKRAETRRRNKQRRAALNGRAP